MLTVRGCNQYRYHPKILEILRCTFSFHFSGVHHPHKYRTLERTLLILYDFFEKLWSFDDLQTKKLFFIVFICVGAFLLNSNEIFDDKNSCICDIYIYLLNTNCQQEQPIAE